MTNKNVLLATFGCAVIAMQVGMFIKITSVKEDAASTREIVGKVKTDVAQLTKDVEKINKKVERLEKTVIYKTKEKLQVSSKDLQCLAKNIYHEAGVEDRAGKIAVAQITLNRVNDGRWGTKICDVVYAKAQFSWTLKKELRWAQPKGKLWDESMKIAEEFVKGKRVEGLENSHFYHADYISKPAWAKKMTKVKQIGQHIFYQA